MGALVWECDVLIPQLLDRLNLRFCPPETAKVGDKDDNFGGVVEMAALQKEFQVFKKDRPLSMSVKVLGLAGSESARARNRWLTLLDSLPNKGSAIVDKIIENLESGKPRPMWFQAVRYAGDRNVGIQENQHPVPYDDVNAYIVISIPMKPKNAP